MQMPLPACPSKSFRTFSTLWMSAMIQINLLSFWKMICLDSLERTSGSLILICFGSPWKCRASSPLFSWEKYSNSISLLELVLTQTFHNLENKYKYIYYFVCFSLIKQVSDSLVHWLGSWEIIIKLMCLNNVRFLSSVFFFIVKQR